MVCLCLVGKRMPMLHECCYNKFVGRQRLTHRLAKLPRGEFHLPDLINDDDPLPLNSIPQRRQSDLLEGGDIDPYLPTRRRRRPRLPRRARYKERSATHFSHLAVLGWNASFLGIVLFASRSSPMPYFIANDLRKHQCGRCSWPNSPIRMANCAQIGSTQPAVMSVTGGGCCIASVAVAGTGCVMPTRRCVGRRNTECRTAKAHCLGARQRKSRQIALGGGSS